MNDSALSGDGRQGEFQRILVPVWPVVAFLFFLGFLFLTPVAARAQRPDPVPKVSGGIDDGELLLTIPDCIRRALLKNLDISIQRIAPQIASAQTLSARGIFDPNLQLQIQYGTSANQIDANTDTVSYTQTSLNQLSLSQLTPLGTQLSLNVNSASTQTSFNGAFAQYSSVSGLSLTQPLLRGFGTDITEAQIRISLHGEASADAEFQLQLEQIISTVVSAYYEMLYARDNLKAQETSLDLAQHLLEDNQLRVKIGTMTPLDISQATAAAASRRDSVLQARQTLSEEENALKRLISDDFAAMAGKKIVPMDKPSEDLTSKPALRDMAAALENRPDYREAIEQAEQKKIQLVFSQNQILPQLNLNASYGYGGLGTNFGDSIVRLTRANAPQWFVGMSMQVPIGDRTAVGQRNTARLQKAEALLQLKKLEQDILVQVNNASNRVKTNQERVGVSRTASEYAENALVAEQKKLNAGTTTTFTVLQMQRDVTIAKTNELRAVADLHESEVDLFRVEGITLKVYHVVLDHPAKTPRGGHRGK